MKIVHVITDLETGGAQMMLLKLLTHINRAEFDCEVISLAPPAPLTPHIEAVAGRVTSIGLRPRLRDLPALPRLTAALRAARPDVVQTWMYHADLFGGLAARIATDAPVVWNIRSSNYDAAKVKRSRVLIMRAAARLSSRVPAHIVCCSSNARDFHVRFGYDGSKLEVIPNGFDLQLFGPEPSARSLLRQELGLAAESKLVGLIARYHAMKDHAMFLDAARLIADAVPASHFVLCGDGVVRSNEALAAQVSRLGLEGRVHLLGRRTDIPALNAALDLACSSSAFGEGFPNAIGEAMACGVPCVVTDVGDSSYVVGDTGSVVAPGDATSFASACTRILLNDPRRIELGLAARRRVQTHFEIGSVARRYEAVYRAVARRPLR